MSEIIALPAVTATAEANQSKPRAKRDYQALRVAFAEFLMNPFHGTQAQWAIDNDLDPATLSQWKAEPDFVKLQADWRSRAKVAIPDMLARVVQRVLETGDPHAYRAVMETLGESKQEIDLNVFQPFIKLQEQMIAIRKAALDARPRAN